MYDILNLFTHCIWHFAAFMFLLVSVGAFFINMGKIALRASNIRKHGWPPPYCDADGDIIECEGEDEQEDKEDEEE